MNRMEKVRRKDMAIELPRDPSLRIMVFGAGTMGHGIALLAARTGHPVFLVDVSSAPLKKAMELIHAHLRWFREEKEISGEDVEKIYARIKPVQHFEDILPECHLVIEAITEDQAQKAELYKKISPILSPNCVVASNTSYLDIFTLLPESLAARGAIAHFYAPPYLIPLVEVVGGEKTDPAVVPWLLELLRGMGQRPVALERFVPGFIVNRLQRAMGREIFHLLDNGYASAEEIDDAVRASLGLRMPVVGVVRRYDFSGLDLSLKVLSNPSIHLENEDKIPRVLQECVDAGRLGAKTGEGFYSYGGRTTGEIILERDRKTLRLRRFMEKEEISFPK